MNPEPPALPGKSDPLLLLPGMMCDERMWADIPKRLGGVCASVQHMKLTGSETITGLASQVLDAAPQNFTVAGLSMGGIVALEMARLAPGRVTRLALLNTSARPDAPEKRSVRTDQIQRVRDGQLGKVVREELKPTYPAADRDHALGIRQLVMDMALDLGPGVFIQQSLALMERPGALAQLGKITCPTLVIAGREDRLCSMELHREIAAGIPGSSLKVIPECGHLSTLEQPGAVSVALREWLHRPADCTQNIPGTSQHAGLVI